MARPKSSKPKMKHLNLTVDDQTRLYLDYVAGKKGQSISQLVAIWAAKEAKSIAKKSGTQLPTLPDADQLTFGD